MKRDNTTVVMVYKGVIPAKVERVPEGLVVKFKWFREYGTKPEELAFSVAGKPADPRKWREPVHQAFANMNFHELGRVEYFVKHYGISGYFLNTPAILAPKTEADYAYRWFVDPEIIRLFQSDLRRAWDAKQPKLGIYPRSIDTDVEGGHLRLVIRDLWALICAGFLTDHAAGLTRVCAFEGCKCERYFLCSRMDQKCCSKSCRSSKNMQVWRSSAENRQHEQLIRERRKKRVS